MDGPGGWSECVYTERQKPWGNSQGEGGCWGPEEEDPVKEITHPKASAQRRRTKRGDLSSRRKLCHTMSDYLEVRQDLLPLVRKVTLFLEHVQWQYGRIVQKAVGWRVNEKYRF